MTAVEEFWTPPGPGFRLVFAGPDVETAEYVWVREQEWVPSEIERRAELAAAELAAHSALDQIDGALPVSKEADTDLSDVPRDRELARDQDDSFSDAY